MSHFPTACLPQNLPKAVAYFMHTILPAPGIQIISAKFCVYWQQKAQGPSALMVSAYSHVQLTEVRFSFIFSVLWEKFNCI